MQFDGANIAQTGPAWRYVDRCNFAEQRKLRVNSLLSGDPHYRLACVAWRIAAEDPHPLVLNALKSIFDIHTRMLSIGPGGEFDWDRDALVNLGVFQLHLETLRRPFPDLMVIVTGEGIHGLVVQIISHGALLDVLRPRRV